MEATNDVEWPPPPELIILYYLAGADVNIHTTGHSLLFKYAGICPANGVCGSYCVCVEMEVGWGGGELCQNWRVFHHLEIDCNTAVPEPPGDTKDLLRSPN